MVSSWSSWTNFWSGQSLADSPINVLSETQRDFNKRPWDCSDMHFNMTIKEKSKVTLKWYLFFMFWVLGILGNPIRNLHLRGDFYKCQFFWDVSCKLPRTCSAIWNIPLFIKTPSWAYIQFPSFSLSPIPHCCLSFLTIHPLIPSHLFLQFLFLMLSHLFIQLKLVSQLVPIPATSPFIQYLSPKFFPNFNAVEPSMHLETPFCWLPGPAVSQSPCWSFSATMGWTAPWCPGRWSPCCFPLLLPDTLSPAAQGQYSILAEF